MVVAEVNAAEQALIQLGHFLPSASAYLRAQHGRIHVDSQLTALVFPQNTRILHIRLPDDVDGFIEYRHTHRRVNVNVVRVGGFEPAEHLPFRVRQQGFRLCFRPLRNVGQRDFNADGLPVIGAESPLRDGNTLVRYRVPFEAGVRCFAVLIGIAENHIFQVAVIVKGDRVQAPRRSAVEVDVPVLGVGFDGHAARRARLFQLGAEGLHQLSELCFQVLGAGTVLRIAVFVRLAADVPLDLQKHLTGDFGANQRGEVQAFHLAGRQPRG